MQLSSPFNSEWTCSSEYIRSGTPSRRDGISYVQEMNHRLRGTSFIRQTVSSLKLKPICKETAYIYFHRFFMLRSFKSCDASRVGLACVYLASKYEDHPAFKEHMVRIYQLLTTRKDLTKKDKEYEENCDRLIRDENQLLQVLGFDGLGVRHFQVLIVESSSQTPITGFSKAMYSNAYKIASEMNRLTMLCVQYPSHILACVAIFLASLYHGTVLPDGWTNRVKGAVAEDVHLVTKVGDEIKERLARDSDLVKTLLSDNKVVFPPPPPPPKLQPQPQQSVKPHQHQQQQQSQHQYQQPNHYHQSSQQHQHQQQANHYHQSSQQQHQQKRPHNAMMSSSSSASAAYAQFNSSGGGGGSHYRGNNNFSYSGNSSGVPNTSISNSSSLTRGHHNHHHQGNRTFNAANVYNNNNGGSMPDLSGGNRGYCGGTTTSTSSNLDFSQQILSTFSPDSAYSSNSSHSPPEKKRKK